MTTLNDAIKANGRESDKAFRGLDAQEQMRVWLESMQTDSVQVMVIHQFYQGTKKVPELDVWIIEIPKKAEPSEDKQ